MEKIKAIIFDIGGVVTFTDFQALYTNFANRIGVLPAFVSQYHKDNWNNLLLGNTGLEQFFQDMKNAGAKDGMDLKSVWLEEALKIRKINTELLDLIDKLRKNHTVGVLSNLSPSRLMVDEYMGIYDHFDFVVLSCKEHLKKPDPKFYALALQKAQVNATEAIFVDDKPNNIITAHEIGLKDILYTDNNKFLEDLKNLGIEIL
jgi:epoxide hydrolase-like predicted phosphatase